MTHRTEDLRERVRPAPALLPHARGAGRATGRRGRPRAAVVALTALLAPVLLLAGCGLRVETPAPTAPVPDAVEAARERAVADALGVQAAAEQALSSAAPAATAVLEELADDAAAHVAQLGGVYDSGLPDDGSSPSPTSTDSATASVAAADVSQVLALLTDAGARSRVDAASVPDPALARLLAVVTLSRFQDARQLAAAAGLPAPTATSAAVPAAMPTGLTAADAGTIVLAEDEAGFGYEVAAAKLADEARATAQSRAALHRSRAQQWAVLAGIASTGTDPRRVAYDLPDGLGAPGGPAALAASLETSLAATYISLLASATASDAATATPTTADSTTGVGPASTSTDASTSSAPASTAPGRPSLLELADDAWSSALSWGATPVPLPTSTGDATAATATPGVGTTPSPG